MSPSSSDRIPPASMVNLDYGDMTFTAYSDAAGQVTIVDPNGPTEGLMPIVQGPYQDVFELMFRETDDNLCIPGFDGIECQDDGLQVLIDFVNRLYGESDNLSLSWPSFYRDGKTGDNDHPEDDSYV